jgi:D-glycero-D-manno-heptose 1,7-bisphosphate phosphatase
LARKAIFLDRDGTLNVEVNYLSRADDLRLLPGTASALRLLKQHGWLVVVITNQSGVARGYYTEQVVAEIHARMQRELSAAGTGVDAIYYCPHQPDDACACRKPKTFLFEQAAQDLDIDLAASVCIGDKLSDLEPGQRMGCKTILVLTGHGQTSLESMRQGAFQPDVVVEDVYQAAERVTQSDEDTPRL